MACCIYCGEDEKSATFKSVEHIFPKCIGGVRCLPTGWVADHINAELSKLELGFARENPSVVMNRMFFGTVGRKKHSNKERIGILTDVNNASDYTLGYIKNGTPFPLNQIIISSQIQSDEAKTIPVRIVVAPSEQVTHEDQIRLFWEKLRTYKGSPVCIKDDRIPAYTYLLGQKDQRWFLGISKEENPETVKPKLVHLVEKLSAVDAETSLSRDGKIVDRIHQVEATFTFEANYLDYLRVYAKIAFNCLAALKGQDLVLSTAFDSIRHAILTGENIAAYVWQAEGPSPIPDALRNFPERLPLGERCHATVFFQKAGCVYGIVSLYGLNDPIIVKLGVAPVRVEVDAYICDWENHADYTLTDCVLKICRHE